MEAIILCGGFAKRLEPISEFIPKALLPVNGKPLIEHLLKQLEANGEVTRIIISTNQRFADQFAYWLELRKLAGLSKEVELVMEPTTSNETKFGAVRGIAYAIKKAGINEDLLVIAGDNFFTFDLNQILEDMKSKQGPSLLAYDVRSKESAKRFGVMELDGDGKIVSFEEKPESPKSTIVSTGIYYLPKAYVGKVEEYLNATGKGDDIGSFIRWLKDRSGAYAILPQSGEWFDIGTIDGYRAVFKGSKIKI